MANLDSSFALGQSPKGYGIETGLRLWLCPARVLDGAGLNPNLGPAVRVRIAVLTPIMYLIWVVLIAGIPSDTREWEETSCHM